MWELYDQLIEPIPDELYVDEVLTGDTWTMVQTGQNTGLAMTIREQSRKRRVDQELAGMPLREVASLIKSWNFVEAGIGLAAMNAFYNTREKLLKFKADNQNAFVANSRKVAGKKVAVIGHFCALEQHLSTASEINILERNPQTDDYPDSACEYILPFMDFVFITGTTLINKTMPRLLELSRSADVVLLGPSVPLNRLFYKFGVNQLGGFIVNDSAQCQMQVREGKSFKNFTCGNHFYLSDINL